MSSPLTLLETFTLRPWQLLWYLDLSVSFRVSRSRPTRIFLRESEPPFNVHTVIKLKKYWLTASPLFSRHLTPFTAWLVLCHKLWNVHSKQGVPGLLFGFQEGLSVCFASGSVPLQPASEKPRSIMDCVLSYHPEAIHSSSLNSLPDSKTDWKIHWKRDRWIDFSEMINM